MAGATEPMRASASSPAPGPGDETTLVQLMQSGLTTGGGPATVGGTPVQLSADFTRQCVTRRARLLRAKRAQMIDEFVGEDPTRDDNRFQHGQKFAEACRQSLARSRNGVRAGGDTAFNGVAALGNSQVEHERTVAADVRRL